MSEQLTMEIVLDAKARIQELERAGVSISDIKKIVVDAKRVFKDFTKNILTNSKLIVSRGFEVIKKSALAMANAIKKSLKVIDQAFTRIVAVTSLAGGALLKLASDAGEMENKFNVVFGNLAKETDQWANDYGNAINRSKNTIKDMLAENQNLFVGFGMTRESAAKFSKQVVMLTNDLSSFNNIDPKKTSELMISALQGQSMAATSLGASIKEVQLHLSAQQLGLGKYSDKMDETTKMMIRFNAMLMQSPDAIGDSVRTAWDFANVTKGIVDNLKFLGSSIGKYLIPSANDYGKKLLTLIKSTSDWVNTNKEAMTRIVESALSFLKFSAAIFIVIKALVLLTSPMILVIASVVAMKAAWDLNLFGIRDTALEVWDSLSDTFEKIKKSIQDKTFLEDYAIPNLEIGFNFFLAGTALKTLVTNGLKSAGFAFITGVAGVSAGYHTTLSLLAVITGDTKQEVRKKIGEGLKLAWDDFKEYILKPLTIGVEFVKHAKDNFIVKDKVLNMSDAEKMKLGITIIEKDVVQDQIKALKQSEEATENLNKTLEKLVIGNIKTSYIGVQKYIGGYAGFDSGGYTGDGGKYDVAGVVHKGEYVIPKWQVEKNPELVARLEGQRLRGFFSGRGDNNVIAAPQTRTTLVSDILTKFENIVDKYSKDDVNASEYKATAESLKRLIVDVLNSIDSITQESNNLMDDLQASLKAAKESQENIENNTTKAISEILNNVKNGAIDSMLDKRSSLGEIKKNTGATNTEIALRLEDEVTAIVQSMAESGASFEEIRGVLDTYELALEGKSRSLKETMNLVEKSRFDSGQFFTDLGNDTGALAASFNELGNFLENDFISRLASITSNVSNFSSSIGSFMSGGGLSSLGSIAGMASGIGMVTAGLQLADSITGFSAANEELDKMKAESEARNAELFSDAVEKFHETISNMQIGEKATAFVNSSNINFDKVTTQEIEDYVSGSSKKESLNNTALASKLKEDYGIDIDVAGVAAGAKTEHYEKYWSWRGFKSGYKTRKTGDSYDESKIADEINKLIEEANDQLLLDFAEGIGFASTDIASSMIAALEDGNFTETLENMYTDAQKNAYMNSSTMTAAYEALSKKRTKAIAEEMTEWEKQYANLDFENMSIEEIEQHIADISTNVATQFNEIRSLADMLGEELGNSVASSLSQALDSANFSSFSSSLGQIIYDTVKTNLIESFIVSAQIKERLKEYSELYEAGNKDEAAEKLKQIISDMKDSYEVIQTQLEEVKEEAKKSGADFTSDSGTGSTSSSEVSGTYYQPPVDSSNSTSGTTVVNYNFDFTNANVYNEQMLEDKIKTTINNNKEA